MLSPLVSVSSFMSSTSISLQKHAQNIITTCVGASVKKGENWLVGMKIRASNEEQWAGESDDSEVASGRFLCHPRAHARF